MKVSLTKLEKHVVQLEIEVEAEKFEEGMNKAFIKNKNRFSVPGFRKGKAPRSIVERYYGEAVLYEDAVNIVCPEAYDKAVEEQGIHPVEQPEIDIKQIGSGQPLIFTAKVTVKPEVELGEYKGIEIEEDELKITDEDVDKELQSIAERNARIITIEEERALEENDIAVIDFEGFIDNEPFEGGKAENYELTIGKGQFIEGFEEQLKGMKAGEEREINVTFPENYHAENLAGKPAVFKVKLKQIKVKELPEIDDEFAKDVSEFDTLAEYKEDLKKQLTEREEKRIARERENNVIRKVVENAKVDIPQVMIDRQIDNILRDFDMRLRFQGMDLPRYLQITNTKIEDFRSQFNETAENDVKTRLVLEKICEVENIQVTDELFEEEVRKMAEDYKQSVEDFKKNLNEEYTEYIKENLKMQQTVDFLVSNAKINVKQK